ncbi:outer membrane protein [Mesorhizobium sp. ANAO-SY3R2]|uniref:outer membrane protein n=1 Tax=Mesorhizobium sp. ANAO-SY3R2 TaxID=3166644 RepID=UPI00366BE684
MKTALLATTFLFAAAGSALASDAVAYEAAPEAAAGGFVWTGGYIGLHAGYAWTQGTGDYLEPTGSLVEQAEINSDGWLGGIQVGYNYQINNWVIGVEGDIAWSNANGLNNILAAGSDVADIDVEMDWLASLTARAGIAFDRTLFYAKGGIGFSHIALGDTGGNGMSVDADGSDTVTGWTLGGGIEHAVTDNWTVKAEYQYYRFNGNIELHRFVDGGNNRTYDDAFDAHALKIGVNYKF